MASYCPHCGAPAPDEARFCMTCGRERVPAPAAEAPSAPAPAPEGPAAPGAAPGPPALPGRPPQPPPAPAAVTAPGAPPPGALPPGPPPPPVHAPVPAGPSPFGAAPVSAGPSPFGAFLGRTFRGDWAGAAKAALWPVGLLLVAALALAIPSYGQDDEVVVGFADRMRIALAVLLQALGGGFELKEASDSVFGGGDGGGFASEFGGGGQLSLIPLTVTALWIAACYAGVRMLRTRSAPRAPHGTTAGLEAAVRVALLITGAVFVTGLFAQPTVAGEVEISTSPWLAALGALLLGLAVACGVLHRDGLSRWLAARPGARACLRATGTALRALAVVLVLCSLVVLVLYALGDDRGDTSDLDASGVSPFLIVLLLLPNLAVLALGLSWGAPVEVEARGSTPYGGGYEHQAFGLSELGDAANSWAVAGALALGLVCALTLGLSAARRSADRREQLLAAGIFFGLFLLLAGIGGFRFEVAGGPSGGSGPGFGSGSGSGDALTGSFGIGVSVPDALLLGLLWILAAAFLAPYLLQLAGARTTVIAPPVPPMPSTPAGHPAPRPHASAAGDPHTVRLGHEAPAAPASAPAAPPHAPDSSPVPAPPYAPALAPAYSPAPAVTAKPRTRAVVWVVTLAAAFAVGGGAAAGVLVWQDMESDGTSNKARTRTTPAPASSPTADGRTPSPRATDDPVPSGEPTEGAAAAPGVPDGYHRLADPMGFSFAVPDVWAREGVKNGTQVTYAGSTGLEHLQVGVIANAGYTSYDNFVTLEKTAKRKDTGYHRIKLERNTFQGRAGAVWEYTYTDESGRTVHAKDQGYVADDGTEYAIMIVGHDELWEGDLAETFRVALESWELT
ncbi:zinc ribbon domain-containing protein [Streptomyces sp. NPDC005551]|uniref:zinc ribbon domain-containing protein n=1 Tax=Streptomyces sp. NPDC005551 TaxID=3364725 RepID=UPI0036AE1AE6